MAAGPEEINGVVVICDAVCLRESLNLVLQILEITPDVVLCLTRMDEAYRRKIKIRLKPLQKALGIPIIGITARKKNRLRRTIRQLEKRRNMKQKDTIQIEYGPYTERAIQVLQQYIEGFFENETNRHWLCARLLEGNETMGHLLAYYCGVCPAAESRIRDGLDAVNRFLYENELTNQQLKEELASAYEKKAAQICKAVF